MAAINTPHHPLQLKNKSISFPYINNTANANTNPIDRLLVDIDEKKSNLSTVSLKYAYCEFYPEYDEYLKQTTFPSLDDEIYNYYNTMIKTKIAYKYKPGQFGYIHLTTTNNLERSFVKIIDITDSEREIFFLHDNIKRYKYRHYDITASKPKISTSLKQDGWIIESAFTPIDGTINTETNDATQSLIELLNWKICREDYLLKAMNTLNGININELYYEQTSYINDESLWTDTGTSTDNGADIKNISSDIQPFGYRKNDDIDSKYTLKGELFSALNLNKTNKKNKNKNKAEEPVAIKKMSHNGFQIVIDTDLVKESLILRNLKTKNKLIRNSIVNYTDFFQSPTNVYLVMELNFNIDLKQFVLKSHEYIKNEKLDLMEYKEIIKYLLWRLTATIHWLHNDMNCCDLDICPENIMLSQADFIQNEDGSMTINLQIEMKLIDFGIREMLQLCNSDKLGQFESRYNEKYLSLKNEQYLAPDSIFDAGSNDMWSFGMLIYFCFIGNYPYNLIPATDDALYTGYWAVQNGKLKEYLGIKNNKYLGEYIDFEVLSLISGLLNSDASKRLNITDVLHHKWFNSFYKAYLSLCISQQNT